MDLELKSDLEREEYLLALGDPVLHYADEAFPVPQERQPETSSHQPAVNQAVEPVVEKTAVELPPLPLLPQTEPLEPSPQLPPQPAKQPAPLTPPDKEPNAVKRTKRWSRGMFAALTSRNDKS